MQVKDAIAAVAIIAKMDTRALLEEVPLLRVLRRVRRGTKTHGTTLARLSCTKAKRIE